MGCVFSCLKDYTRTLEHAACAAAAATGTASFSDEGDDDDGRISVSDEIPEALQDYVSGDQDESNVRSLLDLKACNELKNILKLSLPREPWADTILQLTPPRNSNRDPSTTTTSQTSGGGGGGGCVEPSLSPCNSADDPEDYWRRAARNMMTFELGRRLSDPEAVVCFADEDEASEAECVIEKEDADRAYSEVTEKVSAWIRRRLSAEKVGEVRSQSARRITLSGQAAIAPGMPNARRNSPKMFLDDTDDEVCTFIGSAACDVPLLRVNLLRCNENSVITKGIAKNGLIIIGVDLAEQISLLTFPYTKWIIQKIVEDFLVYFDFIRLYDVFCDRHRDVVDALIINGVFEEYGTRVIRFADQSSKFHCANVRRASATDSRSGRREGSFFHYGGGKFNAETENFERLKRQASEGGLLPRSASAKR